LLESAVAAFQSGQFDQAEHYCRQVSSSDDAYLGALHILGLIALQRGQLAKAERLLKQAIEINPLLAEPNCNLAFALSGLGRFEEALASCDRALAINPDHLLTLNNRGNILLQLKRPEEALITLDRALSIQPNLDALCNRGNALASLRRYSEAVEDYNRFLLAIPDDGPVLTNRGNALWALDRKSEALADYTKAVRVSPNDRAALIPYGNALLHFRRAEEALESFNRVLQNAPDDAEALNHRGKALHYLGRLDEALSNFDRALAIRPDEKKTLINRGFLLDDLTRFKDALDSFARAQLLDPADPAPHGGLGLVQLRLGNFDVGWRELDCCIELTEASSMAGKRAKPRWTGKEDVEGKSILIRADKAGYGDAIQFARYAELVKAKRARVILKVQPGLKSFFASGLTGCDQIISDDDPLPAHDFYCPLMSLPLVLGTTLATVPARSPYLKPSPALVAKWSDRLGERRDLRVGLVWSGSPNTINDQNRSLPLKQYGPLFLPNIQLVSLQQEVRDSDVEYLKSSGLVHFGDELRDFADTAALVANMDVVISVCTSVGHLSAAMNKPTWIVLSHVACSRWLLDREDSPWYPSARLFRQTANRDWKPVVQRVAQELSNYKTPG
jgi:tetratricopeptide (TPR) repeat protein